MIRVYLLPNALVSKAISLFYSVGLRPLFLFRFFQVNFLIMNFVMSTDVCNEVFAYFSVYRTRFKCTECSFSNLNVEIFLVQFR